MLLITGITGYSGSFFLKELIKNKYEGNIRCIVRPDSDSSLIDTCGLKIEKIVGDVADQVLMDKALDGVDTVIHIASIFNSIVIAKAAAKSNIKRMILVHTTGIYSKFKSAAKEYQNIEIEVEKLHKNKFPNCGLIYLRPTLIYGRVKDANMIKFIKMIDKFKIFPIINHGKSMIQPVNGRDLGKAYYQLLCKNEIMKGDYVLSGEKPIEMLEMFKIISSTLGKSRAFVSVPLWVGVLGARLIKISTLGKIDYVERVQRMGEDRNFPHDPATRDFDFNPMAFEMGIKMEVEEYLKSIHSSL